MAWALALVAVIAVGLPVAAWSITRRLPAPRGIGRLGVGYDAIDKWLLDEYQLAPHDRWHVRNTVFQGRRVDRAALTTAARGLATQVLNGGFLVLRLSRLVGRLSMVLAVALAAISIVALIIGPGTQTLVQAVIWITSSVVLLCAGIAATVFAPKRLRRTAEQALRLNQDGT